MRRRIRILYARKEPTFSERLEQQARAILRNRDRDGEQSGTVKGLEQELASTLDQLESTRTLHEDLRRSLLRQECYTDTELRHMEQRTPRYSPYRFPERVRLQRILFEIERARRRLALQEDDQVRSLQDRLLALVHRHHILAPAGASQILTLHAETLP